MDSSSFWADIKKFEDTLAKDPASYCFAPLAELYRKTGLLEDAISTAQKGTALHPQYVGGYMALGRAYLDKGMQVEAREALQRVASFTPENMLAQKLLCQVYMDSGENGLLKKTLEILLSLNPADSESRMLLESLERVAFKEAQDQKLSEPDTAIDSEFLIELSSDEGGAEDFLELDLLDELEEVVDGVPPLFDQDCQLSEIAEVAEVETESDGEEESSPGIYTATIAELYVAQGHNDQAVEIYRELLANAPGNPGYLARIVDLENLISGQELPVTELFDDPWSAGDKPFIPITTISEESVTEIPVSVSANSERGDELLAILQGWLDNIRRGKECRSGRG
jgi:tetratricopeptide (TPR) repeat protein